MKNIQFFSLLFTAGLLNKVKFIVCETHRIVGGKIVSIHNYQDSGSLMRQLGLMPPPPSETSSAVKN